MENLSVGVDTVAGATVTGMLISVMALFLRRTKDTDERRDEAAKLIMDAAAEREKMAWAERDRALAERDSFRAEADAARAEAARLQHLLDEARDAGRNKPW